MRPDRPERAFGRLKIVHALAVRIAAEPDQRRADDVFRGVDQGDSAFCQPGSVGRNEDGAPAVDRARAEGLRDAVRIIANADRAPHVGNGVRIARVVRREPRHDGAVHVRQVVKRRLVQLAVGPGPDLPLEIGG